MKPSQYHLVTLQQELRISVQLWAPWMMLRIHNWSLICWALPSFNQHTTLPVQYLHQTPFFYPFVLKNSILYSLNLIFWFLLHLKEPARSFLSRNNIDFHHRESRVINLAIHDFTILKSSSSMKFFITSLTSFNICNFDESRQDHLHLSVLLDRRISRNEHLRYYSSSRDDCRIQDPSTLLLS